MKDELLKVETRIICCISNGIVHRAGKRVVLSEIKKEIINAVYKLGLDRSEAHRIWIDAVNKYNVISKRTYAELRRVDNKFGAEDNYEDNLLKRTRAVYNFTRKYAVINDSLVKMANSVARDVETRVKRDSIYGISGLIKSNQDKSEGYSPFFLCSAHIDAAEDHKDWEGKVYFDEDWKKYVTDKSVRKKISAYIRNRGCKSVQWVCGAPVWMVMRPNCRHYFMNLPIDEVLSNSPNSLIKKHKLYNEKDIAEPEEKVVLRRYEKRLMVLKGIYSVIKDDRLLKDIKDTSRLVKKWEKICSYASRVKVA